MVKNRLNNVCNHVVRKPRDYQHSSTKVLYILYWTILIEYLCLFSSIKGVPIRMYAFRYSKNLYFPMEYVCHSIYESGKIFDISDKMDKNQLSQQSYVVEYNNFAEDTKELTFYQ